MYVREKTVYIEFGTVLGFGHLLGILEGVPTNKRDKRSCADQNIGLASFWM